MMENNMAPGTENDPRSGIHDDTILCPSCRGHDDECIYCEDGMGMVSEREYRADKELEKEENQANE